MDCIFPNCKETQHDPFLQCWVCVDLVHPKCAGFSDRKVDHVTNRKKGHCWACCNCCKIYVDLRL